jgi:hypothetical protein
MGSLYEPASWIALCWKIIDISRLSLYQMNRDSSLLFFHPNEFIMAIVVLKCQGEK